jgi:hypothetical protein
MSEHTVRVFECDFCGRESERTKVDRPLQWFTLYHEQVLMYGGTVVHHLCSETCLDQWVNRPRVFEVST